MILMRQRGNITIFRLLLPFFLTGSPAVSLVKLLNFCHWHEMKVASQCSFNFSLLLWVKFNIFSFIQEYFVYFYITLFMKVQFIYNKMYRSKVFSSMNFDNWIYLCSHHSEQDLEHFRHPRKSPWVTFQSVLLLPPEATTLCFLTID